ncbi:MAG: diguanylate cyclase [Vicinamibacterales bacterium]
MPPTPYALVAVSNISRATAFRSVASESLRLESVVVRDGEDALQEIMRRGAPALLIVDLSLPRADGFTVVRRLRRQWPDHQTHIVAVSAHESLRAAARELAASLGISGVLPLDVDRQRLRDTIFSGLEPVVNIGRTISEAVTEPPEPSAASPTPDPEEVIERAALEMRRRFRTPVSVGYLRISDRESLTVHVVTHDADPPVSIGDLADLKLLRQVAESTEPLVVPNVDEHPLYQASSRRAPTSLRGFAAVPVASSHEHLRASFCLLDGRPLTMTASDVDALSAFGRQAGGELDRIASPSAQRWAGTSEMPNDVEALQHLASTDPLTGLANRRGGEKHIANEISRARREKRPLSCVLFDIDRFKLVNDTFGHQAGDQLLRDVSALLRRAVRAYDILIRWGGEEFLLVMPGVDLAGSRMLADRLRTAVEAMDTHGIGPITVSAGTAEFEGDYDLPSTLRTADRRLYKAKAAGRNCVI